MFWLLNCCHIAKPRTFGGWHFLIIVEMVCKGNFFSLHMKDGHVLGAQPFSRFSIVSNCESCY